MISNFAAAAAAASPVMVRPFMAFLHKRTFCLAEEIISMSAHLPKALFLL